MLDGFEDTPVGILLQNARVGKKIYSDDLFAGANWNHRAAINAKGFFKCYKDPRTQDDVQRFQQCLTGCVQNISLRVKKN